MKRCNKCGTIKPLDDFYKSAGMRDGHRNDCRVCNLREKQERYRANPDVAKARVKRWQQANAERVNEYHRHRRLEPAVKRAERAGHLKRKYGITIDQYEALLEAQGGGCAICGRPPRSDISLHVDHDHKTGRIRGILCFSCNNALADFGEDHAVLAKAIAYLDSPERSAAIERRLAELRARPPAWAAA